MPYEPDIELITKQTIDLCKIEQVFKWITFENSNINFLNRWHRQPIDDIEYEMYENDFVDHVIESAVEKSVRNNINRELAYLGKVHLHILKMTKGRLPPLEKKRSMS